MRVIFITGLYPKDRVEELRNTVQGHSLQYAPNEFQWRIVEGLYHNHVDLHVISLPFLPCFPRYKRLKTIDSDIYYEGALIGKMVPYCTIPVVKEYSMKFRLRNEIRLYCEQYKKEIIHIITYNSLGFMQEAVRPLKNKYNIKLCSIITDLIDDATNPVFKLSFAKYVQARLEQNKIWRSYSYTDSFVLLSKYMTERIYESVNNNIVVEGIAPTFIPSPIQLKRDKVLVYTGALEKFAGIENLIDAFMATRDSDFRLVICGSGSLSGYVRDCAKNDSRIEFMGSVTHEDAISIQINAFALINPRLPSVSLTRYSFPSKTIEYLISGTPMIGYKLEGIPEEYYEHMFIPSDESVEQLKETISNVLNTDPSVMKSRAEKAQLFILNYKTATKQCKRIIKFLKKTENY